MRKEILCQQEASISSWELSNSRNQLKFIVIKFLVMNCCKNVLVKLLFVANAKILKGCYSYGSRTLKEQVYVTLKYSICEEKVFRKKGICVSEEDRQGEINAKTGLLTVNGLSSLQKLYTALYLPQPSSITSYNEILKTGGEAFCSEAHLMFA